MTELIAEKALTEDQLIIERLNRYYAGKSAEEVRHDLQDKYADTWNDAELLDQFGVQFFDGPVVHVIRKPDGCHGTVAYVDDPRLYFSFIPSDAEKKSRE
jgi:hypothetical protein